MLSDTKFTVNLQAKKNEDGTFRPWASVIHQDGGRFKTMTLELGEKVFMVEVAALPGVTSSHRSNRPHRTEVRRSTPSCNVSKRVLVSSLSP